MQRAKPDLIEEILELEPVLLRARFAVQPPAPFDFDVTMLQLRVLLMLLSAQGASGGQGPRISDLARQLGVTPATSSTLLDRLVERGLVSRQEDPQDRRQHRCLVTVAGQRLLERFFDSARSQCQTLLDVLSMAELSALLVSMKIMIAAAERLAGAAASGDPSLPSASTRVHANGIQP